MKDRRYGPNYDPKGIGQKSEAQVLACFLKNDMIVLSPFGDNERYDFVIDETDCTVRFVCNNGQRSKIRMAANSVFTPGKSLLSYS